MRWIILIEHDPGLLYGLVALCSLLVGSFLNVVIYRLPKMLGYDWRRECAAVTGKEEAAPQGSGMSLAYPPPTAAIAATGYGRWRIFRS